MSRCRSPLLGACNFHNKTMQRHFYRPVYFYIFSRETGQLLYLLIEFGSKANGRNTTINKFFRYLCLYRCRLHRLKMSSFSLKKNKFRSIDLTCCRSTQPLRLRFLKALNTRSSEDFWSKGGGVIFKILRPFK